MKENIKKFREEKKKLEQSEALKEARKKFVSIRILKAFSKEIRDHICYHRILFVFIVILNLYKIEFTLISH